MTNNTTKLPKELVKIFKMIPHGVKVEKVDFGGMIDDVLKWHNKQLALQQQRHEEELEKSNKKAIEAFAAFLSKVLDKQKLEVAVTVFSEALTQPEGNNE